jgi:hypothetical protein
MILKAEKLEGILKATGEGAFGKLEVENDTIVLRTMALKTTDMSGTIHIYFDEKRQQLMTGRLYDPLPSGLLLMYPNRFYRVFTHIEVESSIPNNGYGRILLTPEAEGVMAIMTPIIHIGYTGQIAFTVIPFRKVEMTMMTTIANLSIISDEQFQIPPLKKGNNVKKSKTSRLSNKSHISDGDKNDADDGVYSDEEDEDSLGESNEETLDGYPVGVVISSDEDYSEDSEEDEDSYFDEEE